MLSASNGISCPDCFHGALGAPSRAQPVLIKPCVGGVVLQDGRGYGPYSKGYHLYSRGVYAPFGPSCERLGPSYDFTPGPHGGFMPHGPPQRTVAGVAVAASAAFYGALGMDDSTRNTLAAGGLLLAAVGLGFAIWKSEHASKPRRRRRRRYATSF